MSPGAETIRRRREAAVALTECVQRGQSNAVRFPGPRIVCRLMLASSILVLAEACGSSPGPSQSTTGPDAAGDFGPSGPDAGATSCPPLEGVRCAEQPDVDGGSGAAAEASAGPREGGDAGVGVGPSSDAAASFDAALGDSASLDGAGSAPDSGGLAQTDAEAGTCTTDSDCGAGHLCVRFVQTKGLVNLSHTQCMSTTCSTADCNCARALCGNYPGCSTMNGQLTCNNNDV